MMQSEIVTVAGRQYAKAQWPRRITARLLDVLVAIGVCVIGGENLLPLTELLSIVYIIFGSSLLRGRSIGKRLVGMKIIDARHGGPCSIAQDLLRQKYLLFGNLLLLLLIAYDSSQGCFDEPEVYVVLISPPPPGKCETRLEKPAKLDLAGMRATVQQMHNENADSTKSKTG